MAIHDGALQTSILSIPISSNELNVVSDWNWTYDTFKEHSNSKSASTDLRHDHDVKGEIS